MSSTERVKKHRQEREKAGIISVDVWIKPINRDKLKKFITKLK